MHAFTIATLVAVAAAATEYTGIVVVSGDPASHPLDSPYGLCVGMDCVNGQAFLDRPTWTMKENNNMLAFVAGDSAGSTNSTMIRLRGNEQVNGGKNAFLIEARHRNIPEAAGALTDHYFNECRAQLLQVLVANSLPGFSCPSIGPELTYDPATRVNCCTDYNTCGYNIIQGTCAGRNFADENVCVPFKVCTPELRRAEGRVLEIDTQLSNSFSGVDFKVSSDGQMLLFFPSDSADTKMTTCVDSDVSTLWAAIGTVNLSNLTFSSGESHVGVSAPEWHSKIANTLLSVALRGDRRPATEHVPLNDALGMVMAGVVDLASRDAYKYGAGESMQGRLVDAIVESAFVVGSKSWLVFDASTAFADLLEHIPPPTYKEEAAYFDVAAGGKLTMKVSGVTEVVSFLSPILFKDTDGDPTNTIIINQSPSVLYGWHSTELFPCPAGTFSANADTTCELCPAGHVCKGADTTAIHGWEPTSTATPCPPGRWCPAGSFYGNKCGGWGYKSENVADASKKLEADCVLELCNPLEECRAGYSVGIQVLDSPVASSWYPGDAEGAAAALFVDNVAYPFNKVGFVEITNVDPQGRDIFVNLEEMHTSLPSFVQPSALPISTTISPGQTYSYELNFISALAPGSDATFTMRYKWQLVEPDLQPFVTVDIDGLLDVISLIVRPEFVDEEIYAGDVVEDAFELFNIGCNYTMKYDFALGCAAHPASTLESWLSITPTTSLVGELEAGAGRPQRFGYVINTTDLPYAPDGVSYDGCFTLISELLPINRIIPFEIPVTVAPYKECPAGKFSGSGLTLTNCQFCPLDFYQDEVGQTACIACSDKFPATLSVGAASELDCQPEPGFYRGPDGNAQIQCNSQAMDCNAAGLELTTLPLNEGWWRTGPNSLNLLECPRKQYCLGGTDASTYCAPHHHGPFCFACEAGYRRKGRDRLCVECDASTLANDKLAGGLLVGGILFAFLCMLVAYVFYRRHYFKQREIRREARAEERKRIILKLAKSVGGTGEDGRRARRASVEQLFAIEMDEVDSRDNEHSKLSKAVDLSVKLRVMVGLTQVISGVAEQFYDDFPPSFHKLADMFAVVSVDLFGLIDLGCLVPDSNHFVSLLVATIAPLLLSVVLFGTHVIVEKIVKRMGENSLHDNPTKKDNTADLVSELRSASFTVWLILLFLVYPGVSATIFRVFVCDTFDDGTSALRVDYSISCLSEDYAFYKAYAGAMVFVYPVGIVLVYAISLYLERERLKTNDSAWGVSFDPLISKTRDEDPALSHLKFLYVPYKPAYYGFEVFELLRKLCQTSLIAFFAPGTATQIIIQLAKEASIVLKNVHSSALTVIPPLPVSLPTWLSYVSGGSAAVLLAPGASMTVVFEVDSVEAATLQGVAEASELFNWGFTVSFDGDNATPYWHESTAATLPDVRMPLRIPMTMNVRSVIVQPESIGPSIISMGSNIEGFTHFVEIINVNCEYNVKYNVSVGECSQTVHDDDYISSPGEWFEFQSPTAATLSPDAGKPDALIYSILGDPAKGLSHLPWGVKYETCIFADISLVGGGASPDPEGVIRREIPVRVRPNKPCPLGTASDTGTTENGCPSCVRGTYQDAVGQQFCKACPIDFPDTKSAKTKTLAGCIAAANFYRDGDGQRALCPTGVDCSGIGASLSSLTLVQGFWRSSLTSELVLRCPREEYCVGGQVTGNSSASLYCREYHRGVYCYECEDGCRRKGYADLCTPCDDGSAQSDALSPWGF